MASVKLLSMSVDFGIGAISINSHSVILETTFQARVPGFPHSEHYLCASARSADTVLLICFRGRNCHSAYPRRRHQGSVGEKHTERRQMIGFVGLIPIFSSGTATAMGL